jgi:hypothetical protein
MFLCTSVIHVPERTESVAPVRASRAGVQRASRTVGCPYRATAPNHPARPQRSGAYEPVRTHADPACLPVAGVCAGTGLCLRNTHYLRNFRDAFRPRLAHAEDIEKVRFGGGRMHGAPKSLTWSKETPLSAPAWAALMAGWWYAFALVQRHLATDGLRRMFDGPLRLDSADHLYRRQDIVQWHRCRRYDLLARRRTVSRGACRVSRPARCLAPGVGHMHRDRWHDDVVCAVPVRHRAPAVRRCAVRSTLTPATNAPARGTGGAAGGSTGYACPRRRRRIPQAATWDRLLNPSFSRTLRTCVSAVRSVITSDSAIILFE